MLQGGAEIGFAKIEQENPWLASTPLVVKPDQLIKRRGKAGLLAVNKTWPEVQTWISERMGKNQTVCTMSSLAAYGGLATRMAYCGRGIMFLRVSKSRHGIPHRTRIATKTIQ